MLLPVRVVVVSGDSFAKVKVAELTVSHDVKNIAYFIVVQVKLVTFFKKFNAHKITSILNPLT